MQHAEASTLHDFVLNLLTDDTARSAFAADPAGCLTEAGLGEVTAQDVQEVVPLVLDYAQLPSSGSLPDGGDAIQQLQAVADAAGAPDLGSFELAGDATGDGFSGVGTVESETFGFAGEGTAAGNLHGAAVGGSGESPVGEFAAFAEASPTDGLKAGAVFGSDHAEGTGTLAASTDGVAGEFAVAGESFTIEGGGAGTTEGFAVGGSSQSALGDYGLESSGDFPSMGDVDLDSEALSRSSEAAGGTVATYVHSGGEAFAGAAQQGAEQVTGRLEESGAGQVTEPVHTGTDAVTGQVAGGTLPLPEETPELPEVPAELPTDGMPELPDLGDLPKLPELPEQLPELPVANPLPDVQPGDVADSVHDTVSESPLGNVAGQDAALPGAGEVADDLPFGG